MFTKQLTLLIVITIGFSSIQCRDPQTSCPRGEEYGKKCVDAVTCKARVKLDAGECNGQCLCEYQFSSRNDKNECIPVWECPGVCPPNSLFLSCKAGFMPYTESGLTAEEFIRICKPECFCQNGYSWNSERRECLRIIQEEPPRFRYLYFG